MDDKLWAYVLVVLLAGERGFELVLARRNEAWIRSRGAVEYGKAFSSFLFLFHGVWFASFTFEIYFRGADLLVSPFLLIFLACVLQFCRYWCIVSLGKFWNTRVLVLPGAVAVRRGPYKWLKHPNYLVVLIEIALYPALCGCWFTAAVFGAGNVLILRTRIDQEEKALGENLVLSRESTDG